MNPPSAFSTDSDSDSDVSHVSATPPKEPLRRPQVEPERKRKLSVPLPRPASLKTSSDASGSFVPSSTASNTKSASKQEYLAHIVAPSPRLAPQPDSSPFPGTSLLIRRSADRSHRISADYSIDSIPAGFFSKSASFSKLQKHCSITEFAEDNNNNTLPSAMVSNPEDLVSEKRQSKEQNEKLFGSGKSVKRAKKHFNLIGCDGPAMPMKRKQWSNEGNFVKYNMKGYKYNLKRKGEKRSYNLSRRRREYRAYQRRKKAGSENTDYDDLGPVEKESASLNCQLTEEALLNVRNKVSDDNLLELLKLVYGYDSFREGQLDAIKMVLSGKSTMLVLPTGAGKSLCYQIPALVLQGITLVVSPLVALMIDQLKQLPKAIHGGLLSSSQTLEEAEDTMRLLRDGVIKVLFVAPERFLNVDFLLLFSSPSCLKLSLVVVDEAHCISEWSHNFRPSYMRLRASMLQLNAECVLAMTATATRKTLDAVVSALGIPASNLIEHSPLRNNLQLSVSSSGNRMNDLLALVESPPYSEIQSIIVYCKFQSETELVSKYLCDANIAATCYHSGLPAKDRSRVQGLFFTNKIKVVVATVAFGMGLDKKDVGAVIHYSLPESMEQYVQEIGRAGRDGSLSYCHLFFDDATYFKLRSLMHSNGVDEYGISRFLGEVFNNGMGDTEACSLVKESASQKFDMKDEVMLTLLTYLELGEVQYLRLLAPLNITCTVNFHMTVPTVLSENDDFVAAIIKQSKTKQGQFVFDIISLSNGLGVSPDYSLNQLYHLKLKGEITYEMKDPAYCYTLVNIPTDLCSLASHLAQLLLDVEKCQVHKLDRIYNIAMHSMKTCDQKSGCHGTIHTPCLHNKILDYFKEIDDGDFCHRVAPSSPFLRADIKVFLQSNSQAKFTPRAIARILHGLSSPAYPSSFWAKSHFWGRYVQTDFEVVMKAAKMEMLTSKECHVC